MRPFALLTKPVHASGIEVKHKHKPMGIREPYLSQIGPIVNLNRIVPATAEMDDSQTWLCVNSSVLRISPRSGEIANHMKKAAKNVIHAK